MRTYTPLTRDGRRLQNVLYTVLGCFVVFGFLLGPQSEAPTDPEPKQAPSAEKLTTVKQTPPAEKLPMVVIFEGYSLPGTAIHAEKSGLTVCEAGSHSVTCHAAEPPVILGVQTKDAYVDLDRRGHFTAEGASTEDPIPLGTGTAELSYLDVKLVFEKRSYLEDYDQECEERRREMEGHPDECGNPGTIAAFRVALAKDRWEEDSRSKGYWAFFKRGVALEISGGGLNRGIVTVKPMPISEVDALFAERDAKAKSAAEKQSTLDAVVAATKGSEG